MLFNTLNFALFFACVYLLYWILPRRAQNLMLLAASYFFYGCWDWRFLSLILASTAVDYFCGRALPGASPRARRFYLLLSLVTNLGLLGFFKYFNFFAASLQELAAPFGIHLSYSTLNIVLPVGISFYTFQTLSYTIDVYRGEIEPCRDPWDFALFVAFFPQLVAGPIERARCLLPQIRGKRTVTRAQLYEGTWLILWGLFKKVCVADRLAPMVDRIFADPSSCSGAHILVGLYAFAFQIYGDFSGYSDMARGLAKVMGFEIRLNFNLPYFAVNPSDFWKRWHISLSTWLRDYLYISLGGNRKGRFKTYRNLMLTMLLGGLWHGAAWTFVAWGFYHGTLLILHRLAKPILVLLEPKAFLARKAWWGARVFVMLHLTCLGWLLFRAQSLGEVHLMLERMVLDFGPGASAGYALISVLFIVLPLLVVQWAQFVKNDLLVVFRWPVLLRGLFYFLLYYGITVYGVTGGKQFIYFQF